jgi:hypothetical protein
VALGDEEIEALPPPRLDVEASPGRDLDREPDVDALVAQRLGQLVGPKLPHLGFGTPSTAISSRRSCSAPNVTDGVTASRRGRSTATPDPPHQVRTPTAGSGAAAAPPP